MDLKPPTSFTNKSTSQHENGTIVSLEQKVQIEKIEQLPISPSKKLSLVSLILNKRKVSDISIGFRFQTEKEVRKNIEIHKKELKEEMQILVDSCRDIGLEIDAEQYEKETENSFSFGWDILVAKNKNLIEKLKSAYENGNDKEIGTLFGYPATAVTWYSEADDDTLSSYRPKEIKTTIAEEGLGEFLNFRPSPRWREELDEVKNQKDLIKTYAPILFQELLNEAEKRKGQTGGH